ncbi:MAG: hypothetical protein ACLQPH_15095 [Acidimicrobiales bacterium]
MWFGRPLLPEPGCTGEDASLDRHRLVLGNFGLTGHMLLVAALAAVLAAGSLGGCSKASHVAAGRTSPSTAVLPSSTASASSATTARSASPTSVAAAMTTSSVSAPEPLGLRLRASPTPVAAGQTLVYTITVTNAGSSPLVGVRTRLALPDYVQWTSWSFNCEGQGPTFFCTFGDTTGTAPPGPRAQLPASSSETATITTMVEATPTVSSFSATVTASATAPSGTVTASAPATTTES